MDELINLAAQIYILVIIAAAVVSWIEVDAQHPLIQFLRRATEPVFKRIRDVIPPFGGLDLSPLFALVLVIVVKKVLGALMHMAG
jgi:YggT family protein